jgi:hypothetical protein
MGIGAILDRSFQFYRSNFPWLLYLTLILLAPFMLLQNLFMFDYSRTSFFPSFHLDLTSQYMQRVLNGSEAGDSLTLGLLLVLFGIITWLGAIPVLKASIIFMVKSFYQEQTLRPHDLLKISMKRIWPIVGGTLIFYLRIFGVYVLFGLIITVVILLGTAVAAIVGSEAIVVVFAALGGLVFLSLLVLCGIRWCFYLPLIAVEQEIKVFKKSWLLTNDNSWRLLAIFFLGYAIPTIITLVFQFVFVFLSSPSIIGQLLNMAVSIVLTPVTMVVYAFAYFDLKVRKEGGDLREMIAANLPQPETEAGDKTEIQTEVY